MFKVRNDLAGKTFGRLTVMGYSHTNKHGKAMWNCKCACGNESVVAGSHLVNGHTVSCGCHKNELIGNRTKTHGMRNTRLYRIWLAMKSRCNIPTVKCYKHYGGRGISVCDEWQRDFQCFHDWAMSHGYSENLSIDRIDVNGNYCPENCRWATWKEQRANQRKVV